MTDDDWQQDHARSFALFLNGDAIRDVDDDRRPIRDDSFLLRAAVGHESRSSATEADGALPKSEGAAALGFALTRCFRRP